MASLRKLNKITKAGKKAAKALTKRTRVQTSFLGRKVSQKQVVSRRGRTSFAQAPLPSLPTSAQGFLMLSTAIRSWTYKIRKKILRITWVSGHVYDYFDVPAVVVQHLENAPSKGRYVYYNIRTSYKYTRVR